VALKTLGTNATTSLTAYQQAPGISIGSGIGAQLKNSGKNDLINGNPRIEIYPGKIDGAESRLFVPNRGSILVLAGDWIVIDSTGWPILISKNGVANGAWTKVQLGGNDQYSFGSTLTTSLNAFVQNSAVMAQTDLGNFNNAIKNDLVNGNPIYPTAYQMAFGQNGRLEIPNRGFLVVRAGDYVAYDSTGWPILVSANAIANGPWTHN